MADMQSSSSGNTNRFGFRLLIVLFCPPPPPRPHHHLLHPIDPTLPMGDRCLAASSSDQPNYIRGTKAADEIEKAQRAGREKYYRDVIMMIIIKFLGRFIIIIIFFNNNKQKSTEHKLTGNYRSDENNYESKSPLNCMPIIIR